MFSKKLEVWGNRKVRIVDLNYSFQFLVKYPNLRSTDTALNITSCDIFEPITIIFIFFRLP